MSPSVQRVAGLNSLSPDGRTLTILVEYSSCGTTRVGGGSYETGDLVVVGGWTQTTTLPEGEVCAVTMTAARVNVHLARPLGTRTVLDAATGLPLAFRPSAHRP